MAVDYAKAIGFKGQFLIEPKPKEPTKHQYDSDAAACINFLRANDLMDHFKLNIETNHATLAGHTMMHELDYAGHQDALGSIDANTGVVTVADGTLLNREAAASHNITVRATSADGSTADTVMIIASGPVHIDKGGTHLAKIGPGSVLGEMALINSELRSATVTASTDCVLASIDQTSFDALLRHVPDFAVHVMNVLAERLKVAFEMIED